MRIILLHVLNYCKVYRKFSLLIREGRFEHAGSAYSSSSSLHSIDSALIPYGGAGRAERVTEPHALSSSEEQSVCKPHFGQHIAFWRIVL